MAKLALTDFGGAGDAPPLVLLHGLLGTARNLSVVARAFKGTRRVIGFDMRNHGASPWMPTNSYLDMVGDLVESLSDIGGAYDLLGHSMGGKTAMLGVLTGALAPRKMVIGDIAPVGYAHTQAHTIEAMLDVDLENYARRGPLAQDLGERLNDPAVGAFLAQAAELGTAPKWTHNLAVLLAEMDKIIGFPVGLPPSDASVLFVAGGASDYVAPMPVMNAFPKAQIDVIDGAGHWVHAEAPTEFNDSVAVFLDA